MSNVLQRFQGISEMEFYQNATVLYKNLSRFLMSEKNIPKRWRFVHVYPILDIMNELFDCMVEANDIYPYNEQELNRRKGLQDKCIKICDIIYERLQRIIDTVLWEKLHQDRDSAERVRIEGWLTTLGNLLDREIPLLKGWKKSTKLLERH